ncbi:amidohydrolase family protein [Hyphomonas pacifica]|uniref:Amidohydrolase-related domain-containing protein n=1 Tax=Hyphomonas pacifica TaxID=1280941 RepID=A0A062TSQ2_9PROT|nr:amidohydrolase family protein [Hyphomonas pacifica]KCZ50881.1 hypothetical protein HY2_13225 [Hyphomonas pacifica]RAN33411.1 hypothetical protein HY3_13295 [Hyphomonas pacifica]
MMKKLDAHMHVWRLDRGDYDWLSPELGPIYRDFNIDDVWEEAEAENVQRVILVQAAGTLAETEFMLSLARQDRRIAGVVGWVNLEDGDAAQQIARLAEDRQIVGVRPMIADLPQGDWILDVRFRPLLDQMARLGLVLDGHARADLIPVKTTLAQRHPELQIVLNHAGKPPIASGGLATWRKDLAELAICPNVTCKMSGLLTEAGTHTDDNSIGTVVEHVADCFGPERVMWGGDWPVLTLAGTYTQWAEQSERLIRRYFAGHEHAVCIANAERIYLSRKG